MWHKDSRPSWSNASISRRNVVNKVATVTTVQLRQNKKGNPKSVAEKKLSEGEMVWKSRDNITVMKI